MTYPYRTTMALNTYQYRETTMIDPKKIEQIARQDRDALLEARNKYLNSTREETAEKVE